MDGKEGQRGEWEGKGGLRSAGGDGGWGSKEMREKISYKAEKQVGNKERRSAAAAEKEVRKVDACTGEHWKLGGEESSTPVR